jgi:hypothetical protein
MPDRIPAREGDDYPSRPTSTDQGVAARRRPRLVCLRQVLLVGGGLGLDGGSRGLPRLDGRVERQRGTDRRDAGQRPALVEDVGVGPPRRALRVPAAREAGQHGKHRGAPRPRRGSSRWSSAPRSSSRSPSNPAIGTVASSGPSGGTASSSRCSSCGRGSACRTRCRRTSSTSTGSGRRPSTPVATGSASTPRRGRSPNRPASIAGAGWAPISRESTANFPGNG